VRCCSPRSSASRVGVSRRAALEGISRRHWPARTRDVRRCCSLTIVRARRREFAEATAEVNDKELAIAEQLVDSLSATWDPERFTDTYRERVIGLIQAKAEGREIVEHAQPEPTARVDDLMAALEASLAAATQQAASAPKKAPAKKPRRAAASKKA
jgi:DNA end-binding protein Ku